MMQTTTMLRFRAQAGLATSMAWTRRRDSSGDLRWRGKRERGERKRKGGGGRGERKKGGRARVAWGSFCSLGVRTRRPSHRIAFDVAAMDVQPYSREEQGMMVG